MAVRFGIFCAFDDWAGPPRTAGALARHGAEVCIVAPATSYAAKTRHRSADILMPFTDLNRNLPPIARSLAEDFGAHSILADDDLAFGALARFSEHMDRIDLSTATRAMLARSMPAAETAALLALDSDFIAAQSGGLCPPPRSLANPTLADATAFAAQIGYPVMLKRDGHASGNGVRQCENAEELRAAMDAPAEGARHATFVIQEWVEGAVYGATVSGVKGRAMAAICFKKQVTVRCHGATSVARIEQREDILAHARGMFEACGLNGYAGFDYIIDEKDVARFIEINPRIMPTGHFDDGVGVDLTAAFLAGVRDQPAPASKPPRHQDVALFPNEWGRDVSSDYLRTAFHDVPWDDPPIFAAQIDRTLMQRTPVKQSALFAYLRGSGNFLP